MSVTHVETVKNEDGSTSIIIHNDTPFVPVSNPFIKFVSDFDNEQKKSGTTKDNTN